MRPGQIIAPHHRFGLLRPALVALIGALSVAPVAADHRDIDTDGSTLTVRVFKSGLFRAFGHNHEVQAPLSSGYVDDGPNASVQITVNAQKMKVVDTDLSADDLAQTQTRMLGPEVLDVTKYPEIHFESTTVTVTPPNAWTVYGQLSLHGQTHSVTVKVVLDSGHYKGSVSVKQSSFGIKPVSAGGGTVNVKDEVTIDFDIVTRSTANR